MPPSPPRRSLFAAAGALLAFTLAAEDKPVFPYSGKTRAQLEYESMRSYAERRTPEEKAAALKKLQAQMQRLVDRSAPLLEKLMRLGESYSREGELGELARERDALNAQLAQLQAEAHAISDRFQAQKRAYEVERIEATARQLVAGRRQAFASQDLANMNALEVFHHEQRAFRNKVNVAVMENDILYGAAKQAARTRRRLQRLAACAALAAGTALWAFARWRGRGSG